MDTFNNRIPHRGPFNGPFCLTCLYSTEGLFPQEFCPDRFGDIDLPANHIEFVTTIAGSDKETHDATVVNDDLREEIKTLFDEIAAAEAEYIKHLFSPESDGSASEMAAEKLIDRVAEQQTTIDHLSNQAIGFRHGARLVEEPSMNHLRDIAASIAQPTTVEKLPKGDDLSGVDFFGRKLEDVTVSEESARRSSQRLNEYVASAVLDAAKSFEPGYHVRNIEKADIGTAEKIREETEEFLDAVEQGVRLMALVELSDLVGAIEAYLEVEHPGFTLTDLCAMKDVTKRAFKNGHR